MSNRPFVFDCNPQVARPAHVGVRPATLNDVNHLRGKFRESDRLEVAAACGLNVEVALEIAFCTASKIWTGFVNGSPITIFGVTPDPKVKNVGIPWLLATDDFEREGKAITGFVRHYVNEMRKGVLLLENYVDERHTSAHRWLRWCGFRMDEPAPWGVQGLPFRRFWMEGNI